MLNIQTYLRVLAAMAVVVGLAFSGTATAAACKGMQKNVCSKNDSCSWVESYKTKTGTSVKGHCRAKPGKGAAKKSGAAADKAKKATTKASDGAKKAQSKAKKVKESSKSKAKKATTSSKDKAKKNAKKATDKAKKKAKEKASKTTK